MKTKIRVKTRSELMKEFGSKNGLPLVPEPNPKLQGKIIEVKSICKETGDAFLPNLPIPLDFCTFEIV